MNSLIYSIDATVESENLGRLINHSRRGNVQVTIFDVDSVPRLIFIAKCNIPVNTEILYDYGDRAKQSIKNYTWLKF